MKGSNQRQTSLFIETKFSVPLLSHKRVLHKTKHIIIHPCVTNFFTMKELCIPLETKLQTAIMLEYHDVPHMSHSNHYREMP